MHGGERVNGMTLCGDTRSPSCSQEWLAIGGVARWSWFCSEVVSIVGGELGVMWQGGLGHVWARVVVARGLVWQSV